MSDEPTHSESEDRLLTFEIGETIYALPIGSVLEVAESDRISCVPSLGRLCGGVVNWHGDALPVVSPELLFSGEATVEAGSPGTGPDIRTEHILVVTDRSGRSAQLGIPIDRVLGLVDGKSALGRARELVIERRPVDGRVVSVLDPDQLVARAASVIEQSVN